MFPLRWITGSCLSQENDQWMSRYLVLQPKLYGAGLWFYVLFSIQGSDLSFTLNSMLVQ